MPNENNGKRRNAANNNRSQTTTTLSASCSSLRGANRQQEAFNFALQPRAFL
jgi:hypothetical protein